MSKEDPKDEEDNEDDDETKEKKDSLAKLIYSYPLGPKFKKRTRRK
ncbi:MAG: hypothetical protein ACFFC6_16915 [Promethearchaeota archaeon]